LIDRGNVRRRRREKLNGVGWAGLHTRCAVREARPNLVDERNLREPRLVGQNVRHAELGIHDALELRAERAVLIGAQSACEEQPIADADCLFDEYAKRLAVARRIVGELRRTSVVRYAAWSQV